MQANSASPIPTTPASTTNKSGQPESTPILRDPWEWPEAQKEAKLREWEEMRPGWDKIVRSKQKTNTSYKQTGGQRILDEAVLPRKEIFLGPIEPETQSSEKVQDALQQFRLLQLLMTNLEKRDIVSMRSKWLRYCRDDDGGVQRMFGSMLSTRAE